jgi:hypothetical protein
MKPWVLFVASDFPKMKTHRWLVRTAGVAIDLGEVKWFGRWRQYVFFPLHETIFDKSCLRDIADFCEEQTKLQRKRRVEAL